MLLQIIDDSHQLIEEHPAHKNLRLIEEEDSVPPEAYPRTPPKNCQMYHIPNHTRKVNYQVMVKPIYYRRSSLYTN